VYDGQRLRTVLGIANQVGDVGNQEFFFELLEMTARLDGDAETAEGYGVAVREVRGKLRGVQGEDDSGQSTSAIRLHPQSTSAFRARFTQRRTPMRYTP
jgi:hypothetical protein